MSIIFYSCSAEPNRINKSGYLQTMQTVSAYTLLDNSNNHNPSFRVDSSAGLLGANYCFWEEAGRYYYVTVTALNAGLYQVQGTVDPLHTYRNAILNSSGVATRCNVQNEYLPDDAVAIQSNRQIEYKKYPGSLYKNLQNILIVAGGDI